MWLQAIVVLHAGGATSVVAQAFIIHVVEATGIGSAAAGTAATTCIATIKRLARRTIIGNAATAEVLLATTGVLALIILLHIGALALAAQSFRAAGVTHVGALLSR